MALGLASQVAAFAEVPRLLVYQLEGAAPSQGLGCVDELAGEIDKLEKVKCIAVSLLDPIYSAAYVERKVPKPSAAPSEEEMRKAAKALRCDYLMMVSVKKVTKGINGSCILTLPKGAPFKFETTLDVSVDKKDPSEEEIRAASIAGIVSSIASALDFEPLRLLPKIALAGAGVLPNGQAPKVGSDAGSIGETNASSTSATTNGADKVGFDLALANELMRQAKVELDGERPNRAVALLRQAIDVAPLLGEPRRRLAELYTRMGLFSLAVQISLDGARMTNDPALLLMASRTMMRVGQFSEAREALNTAVMMNPNEGELRSGFAELCLRERQVTMALDHATVAVSKGGSAEAILLLAVSQALSGNKAESQKNLKLAFNKDATIRERLYLNLMTLLDDFYLKQGPFIRGFYNRLVANRDDADANKVISTELAGTEALLDIAKEFFPPKTLKKSHEARLLALNLLLQSLGELRDYASSGSEELITDARIDLGEAIRTFAEVRATLIEERARMQQNLQLLVSFTFFAALTFLLSVLVQKLLHRASGGKLTPVNNAIVQFKCDSSMHRSRFLGFEKGCWVLSAPLQRNVHVPLRVGTHVKGSVTTPEGLAYFEGEIRERHTDPARLLVSIGRPVKVVDRRSESRSIRSEGAVVELNGTAATILDRSDHGLLVSTELQPAVGETVVLHLHSKDISARVVQSDRSLGQTKVRLCLPEEVSAGHLHLAADAK